MLTTVYDDYCIFCISLSYAMNNVSRLTLRTDAFVLTCTRVLLHYAYMMYLLTRNFD